MKKLWIFSVKSFGWLLSWLPRPWLRACGSWVGWLWFDVFGFRKDIILNNMNIAFPEWSDEKKLSVGRKSVYNLGYNFMELLTIPAMNHKWLQKHVVFHGWENVEAAGKSGKGFFFLSLHLGNGDTSANAVALRGQPIYIISKRFKTKWFDELWFALRGAQGVKYIDAHGPNNAFEILKALKKNAGIVFVLDQFMGRPYGIATQFFGRRTGTAYGLALFVQKTKAPVLPIYTYEGTDGKIHIHIEAPLDTASCVVNDNKDQTIANLTQTFNDKLEEIIRKYPEQWMWVHRRWKDFQ